MEQRRVVAERAGYACELCGRTLHDPDTWSQVHSFHHRQPRGMGGTSRPDVHAPSELLLLCGSGTTGCHGDVEQFRTRAYRCGWLVKHGQAPADTPVVIVGGDRLTSRWVILTADGTYDESTG